MRYSGQEVLIAWSFYVQTSGLGSVEKALEPYLEYNSGCIIYEVIGCGV